MVTINRKLGNGFVFNVADSSKDQEHYFSGAKKAVRAAIVGATAQADSQNFTLLGSGSGFRDIAVSSSGKLFVVGQALSASTNRRWMVISSSDGGSNWAYVDLTGGLNRNNTAESIAISANGKIFVCGAISSSQGASSGSTDFLIRSSSDAGATWGNCFTMHTGSNPRYTGVDAATVIATHPTDQNIVYCAGASQSSSLTPIWKVVKSADAGVSWALVDSYEDSLAPVSSSVPICLVVSSSGLVIAGGGATLQTNSYYGYNNWGGNAGNWTIRTSSDAGATWGTVDYDKGPASYSQCNGLWIMGNGKIFATGIINGCLVVKSSSLAGATGSWYTVFSSSVLDGGFAVGYDICSDNNNNIIVIGSSLSSSLSSSIILLQSRNLGVSGSWSVLDKFSIGGNQYGVLGGAAISISGSQFYYTTSSGSNYQASTTANLSGVVGRVKSLIEVAGLTSFCITGSQEVYLLQQLRDSSNSVLNTGSFIQTYFGLNADTAQKKLNPYLTFKVSSSITTFNDSDFLVEFRDENSSAWSAFKNVKTFGSFYSGSDGYFEYRSLLISESAIQEPVVKFLTGSLLFKITTLLSSTIYSFADFKLEFDQTIPDGGVEKYKTLENQNIKFSNTNFCVMKKVE